MSQDASGSLPRRRVLVVAPNTAVSGAERVLERHLRAARAAGHEIAALAPDGPCADLLRSSGAAVEPLPDLAVPTGPRPLALARMATRWPGAAAAVRRAARGADVVVVNGFLALPAVRLARLAPRWRPRVAWLVHDVVRRREWRLLLSACAGAVDRALAVSDAVATPLRAAGLATTVVRNGTVWPVAPAEPAEPTDGVPVVGVNAMLTDWKGQDVLLDAVARLGTDVRVELMGGRFPRDAAYVARLAARAEEPDLRGRVTFLGHVDDPLARLRTWSVAVSASVEPEAAPLNVLEAMSVGVPMVATDHGGTPEVLGAAGLLVAPSDPAAMADALARLLGDRDRHRRCAGAGPRAVADGLRLEDSATAFLAALDDLVTSPVTAGHAERGGRR